MTDNHQMAYICRNTGRHVDQYYLHIDPDVLLLPGVRIANAMANASTTQILPLSMGLYGLDLEVLYSRQVWSEEIRIRLNIARKYEILIPKNVPREYILKSVKVT